MEQFTITGQVVIVLLVGIIGAKLSEYFNLPRVIPLFISGYLIGPQALNIFVPSKLGLSLSAIVTLAIPPILFNEGMRIDVDFLREFWGTTFLLATVVAAFSALGVGLVAYLIFKMPMFVAFLLGAILAATSPEAVFAIAKQLRIGEKIPTIAKAEASLNDATAIVLFTLLTNILLGGEASFTGAALSFARLFFGGLLIGAVLAFLSEIAIKRFRMEEHIIHLSLVIFLATYSAAELIGANGAAAVVASGIVFGNFLKKPVFDKPGRERVLDFWSSVVFLAETVIFLILGAAFSASILIDGWMEAVTIMLLLFFVIRPASIFAVTHFEKRLNSKEKFLISWIGSRGAVSAALAASAIGLGVPYASRIFNVVLVVVLTSLFIVSLTARKMAEAVLSTSK